MDTDDHLKQIADDVKLMRLYLGWLTAVVLLAVLGGAMAAIIANG